MAPSEGTEERYLRALRAGGGRLTASRRAIVAEFLAAGGHVTADELAARVQARHPETAVSTVYRTMDALEQAGLVEHLHLGHGPAVYHLTDHTHLHLVCDGCGEVTDVPAEEVEEVLAAIRARWGFTVDARHFALAGRCSRCAAGS